MHADARDSEFVDALAMRDAHASVDASPPMPDASEVKRRGGIGIPG